MLHFRGAHWVAGLSAVALWTGASAQAVDLTVTTSLIKTHDQSIVYFQDFHDPVNKANNGIKLDYKGGPEVIPNRKQGAALKRGVIDVMFGPSVYYAGLVPCARVIPLSNVPQAELRKNGGWAALDACWQKGLNGKLLAHGMEGATVFHVYLAGDYKSRISKKTGLDLSGFKVRSTAGYHPMFKKMGAVPINISPGDVYTSLERGVVKGLAWPEGGVARYGWSKFIKYRVGPGWWRTSSTIVMNLDAYNKLTKTQRDALDAASIQYEKDSVASLRKLVAIDNKKVFASGVKHVDLKGEAAKAYLDTAYNATWDAAKKRMPAETYNTLRKLLLK
ncbi:MAG: TRAP transporter substrate-binding protein DctP [Rhodospirillaceae bacterium]|jgi:TRAP-type transport system periplasmic protein|nr:TRAP transporter substrate-binding protein DctP [Rhodospirillaceae bacterium]MBT5457608.1 TRAP transporter substrate-binding protein DctP [Rhodospirillaceae bacterium]